MSATAGASGVAAAGASGAPAVPNDSDAGPAADPSTDVTIIAEAKFPSISLMVEGGSCAGGRCTIAAPKDGMLKVALTLEHKQGEAMPVLARWQGCGTPTTMFFPVTPGGSDYILNYETVFGGLSAGATCKADIVEGGWLVFAGNMSLQIVDGIAYCTALQVSPMGVNASCFPPPGTSVAIESDLPRWNCVRVAADGSAEDTTHMQMRLSLTSMANQLISCSGAAQ
jgi:hypothetical protein